MTKVDNGGGGASRSTDPASGTSTATDVSLREFITTLRAVDIRSAKYAVFALFAFGAFAWSEIQRRLEILNHENARLLQQQERTVSQDTYSANEQQRKEEQQEYKKWKEDVDRDRVQSVTKEDLIRETRSTRNQGVQSSTSVISVIIAVVILGLAILNYFALR
jgi:hypothetical protein